MAYITHTITRGYDIEDLNGGAIQVIFPSTVNILDAATYNMGIVRAAGVPLEETRVFCSYDTSSIPDNATISQTRIRWRVRGTVGSSSSWATRFKIGTWIGGTLDSSDWWPGTVLTDHLYGVGVSPVGIHEIQLTPAATANGLVNKTGFTDIGMQDVSAATLFTTVQQVDWTAIYPELIVIYDVDIHPSWQSTWTI